MTSPTVFYIHRDRFFGYEYQKISDFANEHGITLDIKIANSIDSLVLWLNSGQIDLSISPFPMTKSNQSEYLFAGLSDTTSIVLVQLQTDSILQYIGELADQEVYVEKNSAAELRLQQLCEEIGGDIKIVSNDTLSAEELMVRMLDVDSIHFVASDQRVAKMVSRFYPSLDISLQLSVPVRHGWIVEKNNSTLKEAIDTYFTEPERISHYHEMLREDNHFYSYYKKSGIHEGEIIMQNGRFSPYDHLFMKEAERLGWHWTYLASIAYHESRFKSDVVGWSGARGLMGIMPATGRALGVSVDQLLLPEVSIRVAVDCLIEFGKAYKDLPTKEDRIYFTLASYNAGNGHILDAIRLAKKYNAPSDRWYGGVREYVILKSNPAYYNDSVVRFGYMRGRETSEYVDNVTTRQALYLSRLQMK